MARRSGDQLAEGLYEDLLTDALSGQLLRSPFEKLIAPLADVDAHVVLARHLRGEIERAVQSLPGEERAKRARELGASLLEHLASLVDVDTAALIRSQSPTEPLQRLLALHRGAVPERPSTPLSMSTLLTRNRAEPALGHELTREIATADRIDAIIAFVTVGGVRAISDSLQHFSRREGSRFRLLTTTFTGTTEVAAIETLARLPRSDIRISYDTRRTRLHAKAWLFHRDSGLSTAYVGSANLTSTALGSGQEWMVKIAAADLPHVIEKFSGTFNTLWEDPEFERYSPDVVGHKQKLAAALMPETAANSTSETFMVALRALPFQEEILDKLAVEREVHGRRRNLVIAATGTGKTVIAALDYARQFAKSGVAPRLLFLAHRRELLEQARRTFRFALQDASFGELLVDGDTPKRWDHVFASVQSVGDVIERFGTEYFRHVVVDECHHMPAKSYQDVVPRLRPDLLVGLTATPERSDHQSLLPDFDGHVAAELRLWHALDDQLLVPFEYYGISDGVDLRKIRWSRTGYDVGVLGDLYTGHTARADLILAQLARRVGNLKSLRAIGFCVSIAHAEFMANHFTAAGVPARAVYGNSVDREEAPALLRGRTVNVLFTCDLYNEGVDLPYVDTLLLLRPTQSATLFLQQLGRGLRHSPGKATCLVLDFIGQHRDEFRFDATISAITGIPRAALRKAVDDGFPYLPSGCSFQLDAVAREEILQSLRSTLAGAKRLMGEIRELTAANGKPTLSAFLEQTGRDLEDVYDAGGWSTLQRNAGVTVLQPDENEQEVDDLSRRLGRLQHVDEPERLRTYRDVLAGKPAPLTQRQRSQVMMLESQLNHRGVLRAAEESVAYITARPTIVRELEELREVLENRVTIAAQVYPVSEWALALHRHYSRREITAGVGYVEAGDKSLNLQTGILQLKEEKRELLFVTLDKSGKGFSPSTRYRDYAISPELFHWETQGSASAESKAGRRYLGSRTNGWTFYLFVRTDPEAAFGFLGPITYKSHEGESPIAITWRMQYPLTASLFERYATLRPG